VFEPPLGTETPCPCGQQIWPSSILTSPAFFAIMPEFQRASVPVGAHSVSSKTMKGNAKKLSRAVLGATLVVTVLAVNLSALDALQSGSSDKLAATVTPAAAPVPAKATPSSSPSPTPVEMSQTKNAGMVWVNTRVPPAGNSLVCQGDARPIQVRITGHQSRLPNQRGEEQHPRKIATKIAIRFS
jgi:hypothetical protein